MKNLILNRLMMTSVLLWRWKCWILDQILRNWKKNSKKSQSSSFQFQVEGKTWQKRTAFWWFVRDSAAWFCPECWIRDNDCAFSWKIWQKTMKNSKIFVRLKRITNVNLNILINTLVLLSTCTWWKSNSSNWWPLKNKKTFGFWNQIKNLISSVGKMIVETESLLWF